MMWGRGDMGTSFRQQRNTFPLRIAFCFHDQFVCEFRPLVPMSPARPKVAHLDSVHSHAVTNAKQFQLLSFRKWDDVGTMALVGRDAEASPEKRSDVAVGNRSFVVSTELLNEKTGYLSESDLIAIS